MQRKRKKGALHPNTPPLRLPLSPLPLLPETASLSPTAAKTVKHHTASMIFTYSPGLQHREAQNVTNPADGGEGEENRTAEMMAKLERESAKHLMMRVLSSLPPLSLSLSLSPSQLRPAPPLRIWICIANQNDEK